MAYAYTPVYYSSFHDKIASLCASILPFSSRNRRLPADQKLAKRHTESLKWQQDSFHRILNLIGLHKEGIVTEAEVSAFRSHLLETLISNPAEKELAAAIRDKLRFLQELLYAGCISAEEYHSSKWPLLQRLEAQGAEIDSRDVIGAVPPLLKNSQEEWTEIDLNDRDTPKVVEKCKDKTPLKLLWRGRTKKETSDAKEKERDGNSTSIAATISENNKRKKPFHALFQKEKRGEESESKSYAHDSKHGADKSSKNQWGFEGLKKWKRGSCDDDLVRPYLPQEERSDDALHSSPRAFAASPIKEGPETKRVKKKTDNLIDKVSRNDFKKELSQTQSELPATYQNLNFCEDRTHEISPKIPASKVESNKFFPEPFYNAHGDNGAVEMENLKKISIKKGEIFRENWVDFEDNDEGFHPNLFAQVPIASNKRVSNPNGGYDSYYAYNPFR